jgi:hypothetical protein
MGKDPDHEYDPETGLTPQRIHFAKLIAFGGKSQSEAFELAGYRVSYAKSGERYSTEYVAKLAHKLLKFSFIDQSGKRRKPIAELVAELRKEQYAKLGLTPERALERNAELASADLYRTYIDDGGEKVIVAHGPNLPISELVASQNVAAKAIAKYMDHAGMVTQRIEISRDDEARLSCFAKALAENGVDEALTDKVLDSYLRLIAEA